MGTQSAKAYQTGAPIQPPDFFRQNTAPIQTALQNPAIDWERFLDQARAEFVLPAVAYQTELLGIQAQIPAEICQLFALAEALNAERNHKILAEAINVTTLLNQIGLRPVALKGLAFLLSGIYPNPAARYLLDIDFLLPITDIAPAVAHLKRFGYFENENLSFLQFHHHHPAVRRVAEAHIEIHSRVGFGVCSRLLPASHILAQAQPFTFNGADFLTPSPTHLANHLILHSQLAHPYRERIFPPLRVLIDLAQLQQRFAAEINWAGIARTYRDNGQSGTLLLHLKQAHDTLGPRNPGNPN